MPRLSPAPLLAAALLAGGAFLAAQALPPEAAPGAATPAVPGAGDLVAATLPLDIATASFYELADWAASLGLAASGSAAELRARLSAHYGLPPASAAGAGPEAEAAAGRTVLVERASSAEYRGGGEGAQGLIRLAGGAALSVREANGELHRVSARELVYDRDRNAVSARGEVLYRREGRGRVEEFSGESLAVDLDDWSGLFLDGRLRREGAELGPGERGLVFTAETLVKRSGEVLVFEGGTVSACDEEDPHYSIRAGRMWFLGGNDWAVADAVLSVGEVPLLWLPFFYYPSEEIVFHPVLGYRSREGRFLQTTTYLRGSKPPPEKPTGLLRLAPETGPTELRGLFLRRLGGEAGGEGGAAGEGGGGEASLKLMLDLYSGLGAFAGLEGSYPGLGPFSKLSFSLGLGRSRSLFSQVGYYSPFDEAGDWESVWNEASLFGLPLPLRYGLSLAGELKAEGLGLSFSLPLYSDPYFEEDFRDRREEMDWLGLSPEEESSATSPSKRSSFTQRIGLSYSPSLPALSPWLSSFRVTRLDSSLQWQSKADQALPGSAELRAVNPAREFFYPELQKPIDLALELRGSLLRPGASATGRPPAKEGPSAPGEAEPRRPWEAEEGGRTEARAEARPEGPAPAGGFRLPPLAPGLPAMGGGGGESLKLSLDWGLTPSMFWEDRFLGEEWLSFSSVDFEDRLYRLYSYRLAASLSGRAELEGGALSGSLNFSFSDQDQFRRVSEDPLYASRRAAYELADAQYKSRKLAASLKLSSRPFPASSPLASSSFSYTVDSTLYSLSYEKLVALEPVYKEIFPSLGEESITGHSAGFSLAYASPLGSQSLGISLSLPPTRESYTAKLGLEAGAGGYLASLSLQAKLLRPLAGEALSLEPLSGTLKAKTAFGLALGDTLVYDPEAAQFISNGASLDWGWLSLGLQSRRSKSYKPVFGSGWTTLSAEAFRPTELNGSLKGGLAEREGGPPGLELDLDFDLDFSQSLLRFSESTLSFGLDLSLKLDRGFSLTLSSLSQNQSAWRYFPELFPAVAELPGGAAAFRRPLLLDLLESLSFWDAEALKRGLFKLKSLSFTLSQDLHDWDLSATASVAPLLDATLKKYVLDPKFSISVAWRDIPEVKSAIDYDRTGLGY